MERFLKNVVILFLLTMNLVAYSQDSGKISTFNIMALSKRQKVIKADAWQSLFPATNKFFTEERSFDQNVQKNYLGRSITDQKERDAIRKIQKSLEPYWNSPEKNIHHHIRFESKLLMVKQSMYVFIPTIKYQSFHNATVALESMICTADITDIHAIHTEKYYFLKVNLTF